MKSRRRLKRLGKKSSIYVMNMSAQSKKLTILSILFVLCILGLGYWYFFMYKCGVLPKEYEFLNRFVVKNECREKEYSVKGIIYNIREGEDSNNILFDFNAWDTESRESLYYEDIEVNKDKVSGEFEVVPDNYGAVELDLKFSKDIQQILMFRDYNIQSLSVEELKLTEEKYNEVFNTVYTAITHSPLVEDEIYQTPEFFYGAPVEQVNAVFTEVRHRSLFEAPEYEYDYFPELQKGITNKFLYRPWVLSYLYANQKGTDTSYNVGRDEIIEMLSFDMEQHKAYIESLIPEEEKICTTCSEQLNENDTSSSQNKYEDSNSFACLMVYQIFENLQTENESIKRKYCDIDFFEYNTSYYTDKLQISKNFTTSDYLNFLKLNNLAPNNEDRTDLVLSSNYTSLLSDMYAASILYDLGFNESIDERIEFIINYILLYGVPSLRNVCSVSYFTNLISVSEQKLESEAVNLVTNSTRQAIIPISENILKLMDDDVYASLLCLEGFNLLNDKDMSKLKDILTLKIINLNLYNGSEIVGIWENKEYDVRINARFLKLLISDRE